MGVCFLQTIGEENHFLAAGHLWQGNISGGPYTLTEVRLAKGYTISINKYIQYIYIYTIGHQNLTFGMSLTRGDWKWHKNVFDLRHFWRFVRGTCFKCKATKCAGPFQYLVCLKTNLKLNIHLFKQGINQQSFSGMLSCRTLRPPQD